MKVRVAAVQMVSENNAIERNLNRAEDFISKAKKEGAEIVLLPEFLPTGYIYEDSIWESAETAQGITVKWLKEQSRSYGVYLGTSFLEAEGEDFYNTFVLFSPKGEEIGRMRKQEPASFEALFFRGDTGEHVLDTDIGRIGVGICYENMRSYIPVSLYNEGAQLLLMPLSWPGLPMFFRSSLREKMESTVERLPVESIPRA